MVKLACKKLVLVSMGPKGSCFFVVYFLSDWQGAIPIKSLMFKEADKTPCGVTFLVTYQKSLLSQGTATNLLHIL